MPNAVTPTGLQIATIAEIKALLLNGSGTYPGLRAIYGADINVDPNSPDGQFVNLIAQICYDQEELMAQIFSSMDPDQAVGAVLDLRCAINGIFRKAGTKSTQYVTVTVSQALTLAGLDTAPDAPFTVQDNAGNQFQLVTTYAFGSAGSADLLFQAAQIGPTLVAANTLTTITTPQVGVTSVTNGTLSGTVGVPEETDYSLRIRRANSVALPNVGYYDGLVAALLALPGVGNAKVYENSTGSVDANGIPGRSIWVIATPLIDPLLLSVEVGRVIFNKRNAGCGMKGSVSVGITAAGMMPFTVKFDWSTPENLHIRFTAVALSGVVDPAYIKAQLAAQLAYDIGQIADPSAITALVKSIAPNASVTGMEVSNDGATWTPDALATTGVNYQWAVAASRITIT